MAINLMDAVESRLTPDIVGKLSTAVGETPAKTTNAVSAMVPSVFAALLQKSSTESGVTGLLSGLKDYQASQAFGETTDPSRQIMRDTTKGSRLASSMLGNTSGNIVDLISKSSGIRRESSSSILSYVFPVIAGVLGNQVLSRGLGGAGLAELLSSQRKAIFDHPKLPSGLGSALGISDLSQLGGLRAEVPDPHVSIGRTMSQTPPPQSRIENRISADRPRTPWGAIIGALALGSLIIAGLVYFTRGGMKTPGFREPEVPHAEAPRTSAMPAVPAPAPPPAPPAPVEEPAGQTSTTGADLGKNDEATNDEASKTETTQGTMNGKNAEGAVPFAQADIGAELAKKDGPLPDRVQLPNVNFDVGSSKLSADSMATIDTLAKGLKDHPSAKIRLEGYTDSTGSQDVNEPLSMARAKAVKDKLVDKGIDGSRIEVSGLREKNPVGDNESTEGRRENRRTDAVILKR